jgi:hypothetical protein
MKLVGECPQFGQSFGRTRRARAVMDERFDMLLQRDRSFEMTVGLFR